jgi:cytochrome c oxidase subunit 2
MRQGRWAGVIFFAAVVLLTAIVLFGGSAVRPVQEVHVMAHRYSFSPEELTVKAGVPVRLLVSSDDTDHGISIPELAIEQAVTRGRVTTIEFTPNTPGRYEFSCAVYCGPGHDRMHGVLIVE